MSRKRRAGWLAIVGLAMVLAGWESLAFAGGLGALAFAAIGGGFYLMAKAWLEFRIANQPATCQFVTEKIEDGTEPFDADRAVANYRRVIARFEEEATEEGRAEFHAIAKHLRKAWKDQQGADSLHEMAFKEAEA